MRRTNVVTAMLAALVLAAPAAASDSYGPGTTLLMSRPSGLGALPAQSDNDSWSGEHAISANGRFTVFVSDADDLGLAVRARHVYARDDQTGAVTLLDRAGPGGPLGNGTPSDASISGDGSKACFTSYADNLVPGVGANHLYVVTIATGAIVAADRATNNEIADQPAYGCSLDSNGDEVAFATAATNLVAAGGKRHIYVRHLSTGTTQLVDSYQGTPGDGWAGNPSIAGSGQAVAFETGATNLNGPGGDQNGASDVYVRSLAAMQPVLASRADGGAIGNGESSDASISADGQLVAFKSHASNLNDGDGDVAADIHVRNLPAGTTTLVSRAEGPGGAKANDDAYDPEIAGDGSAVAFLSDANNLGADPGDDEEGPKHLAYVRTFAGSHTRIVSRASGAAGALDQGYAGHVSLDEHAENALFQDDAPGLDPLAGGAFDEVFQRHLSGDLATRLVSRPADGSTRPPQAGPVDSGSRSISADGRFVVFSSTAPLDGPGGTGEVYLRDVLLSTTRLVSRASGADGAPANAGSFESAISADGTKVAFTSSATNLADGVDGIQDQVYVRDLVANTTTLASTGASGPSNLGGGDVALSQDGSRIAFQSYATNLVPGDSNGRADVFVRDLVAGTTIAASLTVAGGQPNAGADALAISADGTRVGWLTSASNIGAGVGDSAKHLYVRDLAAGTTTLVDRAADGSPGYVSDSYRVAMSADGNRFAFETNAKLTPDATQTPGHVYVRDVAAGTTTVASIAPDGTQATDRATNVSISPDGTKVAFYTRSSNLPAPPDHGAEWMRNLAAGTTTLLSARDGSQVPADDGGWEASLSADGGCAVFQSTDAKLASPSYAGSDFDQLWLRVVARECPIQAPDTTIASGPSGSAKVRTAVSTFGYKADESNVTFACSLDDAPAKPCGDTFATPALADGVHRFSVAATDKAGNTDPTPALATFTVGVPPRISKLRVVHGRLVFKLSEKATVRARLARHGTKLTLKRSLKAGTRRIKLPLRRLRSGRYRATVTATDAGGNRSVPKRKSFVVRR
jgi:Tol biopolymer transport system component